MIEAKRPILIIPDLQIPYENDKALYFCSYLKKHYKIPNSNILNVGDETDILHGGAWDKDPDTELSPIHELKAAKDKIKEWAEVFPEMKLAISNHGLRWVRKAAQAQIPSQLMRKYEEIYEMPIGWKWQQEWRFNYLKHPFRMIHGMGYSGRNGHYNAVIDSGMSTVLGHIHASAGINYINSLGMQRMLWGMNVGSLIDSDAIAFKYGKYNRAQACLSAGIIFNEGSTPVLMPLNT